MNNLLVAQSGGPTVAINATLVGVLQGVRSSSKVDKVYGARNGIEGAINDNLLDLNELIKDTQAMDTLTYTPSSALGSCRYKMKDWKVDEEPYKKIIDTFKKHEIRYFIYIGGNDSMDTVDKLSEYCKLHNYDVYIMGGPKTVDNDLNLTDHCPGFGSAAKYIATTISELERDINVYDIPAVTIVEIMGRNAGWLTAATALSAYKGAGPDLIYLPEIEFDMDKFIKDVKRVYEKNNGKVIVAVSEGIKDKNGKYISEYGSDLAKEKDAFGHSQLGGTAQVLASVIKNELKCKTRAIEFSLLQRCAAHCGSKTDVEETFKAGQMAVKYAVEGHTDYMVAYEREPGKEYKCNFKLVELSKVANAEKKIPREWITEDGTGLKQEFIDYALPLIQGESAPPMEDGLPRFARLKKVLATK